MRLQPAHIFAALISFTCGPGQTLSADDVLEAGLRHLRVAGPREWSSFPEQPDAERLDVVFTAEKNSAPRSLRLRQQDVKQSWHVLLNEQRLADLRIDENDMVVYFDVPAGALRDGDNTLRIEQDARGRQAPDDVRIGEVHLLTSPLDAALREATVEVEVLDTETLRPLPARITIVDAAGALQTVGAASDDQLAVRPGLVYTADGRARFGVPAGKYTICAGRGFEYSLASEEINVSTGDTIRRSLAIRREVPTEGYVACDTHVHTLTHSGHGDATVQERMITLAAEGIELPIATDHNVQIDHDPFARALHVREYFTPVIGNEVTTKVGHFNIFPVETGARPPDHNLADWGSILDAIYRTLKVKVAILNHARDLHSGTRPFGPDLFNAAVGENLDGWPIRFNAMEVVNSSATQTDAMQLFHDWMGLLNRGRRITPVGSSDSHDVGRHFVGQGRTYIRCDDQDPAEIDLDAAVDSLVQGHVLVSYGLIAELAVNDKYRSGDLATVPDDEVRVRLRVLAPHWIDASRIMLFSNGELIQSREIDAKAARDLPPGVKWQAEWPIPRPRHDVHLAAIAIGPGVGGPWWKTAKPYQPASADWEPHVIGCSGAVWLDVDGDGRPTAAFDYAQPVFAAAAGDLAELVANLVGYDAAVAAQAAHLFRAGGGSLTSVESQAVLQAAAPSVQAGFRRYLESWRENEIARARR